MNSAGTQDMLTILTVIIHDYAYITVIVNMYCIHTKKSLYTSKKSLTTFPIFSSVYSSTDLPDWTQWADWSSHHIWLFGWSYVQAVPSVPGDPGSVSSGCSSCISPFWAEGICLCAWWLTMASWCWIFLGTNIPGDSWTPQISLVPFPRPHSLSFSTTSMQSGSSEWNISRKSANISLTPTVFHTSSTSVKYHSLDFTEAETDSERSTHMFQVPELEKCGLGWKPGTVWLFSLQDGSSRAVM